MAVRVAIEPRLLKLDEAAAYLRITQKACKQLRIGEVHMGAAVLYDRHAIDAYLDGLNGLRATARPFDEEDPEAAFDRSFGPAGDTSRAA